MRVLHISDLHASSTVDADQEEIVAAALSDIRSRDREVSIDLVVFSGDLAFDGSAESLKRDPVEKGPIWLGVRSGPDLV
jgi:3',5'-cyclic AMP phosphodiesterase CpdA